MCQTSVSLHPLKTTPSDQITHSNYIHERLRFKKIESLAQDHTACKTKSSFYQSPLSAYTGVRASRLLS